ncbi:MAG: DUF1295 domain-containing protein [Gammaproteobacteria bacterium]|nr:MAG: DUF1295 domain-containing protein [Gammaproteobacteria bacterium]
MAALAASIALFLLAWLLSVLRRDASIADIFWGPAVAGCAAVFLAVIPATGPRAWLVLGMVAAWALRLSAYIFERNRGQAEDRRYRAMREKRGPSFWWRSLYVVFLSQALLAWIVAWPTLAAIASPRPINWLDAVGTALWLFGLAWETVADRQLARFLASDRDRAAVMDRGLWRYSRHPNYFGECCAWWGLFLVAAAGGAWWTVVSPLLLTLLLLKVSGVALTEKDIGERRPAYRDYMRRTSAFIPRPPARD